jgi:UDP-N-acetylglucosamine 2-epimerase (non-hydrolysing)
MAMQRCFLIMSDSGGVQEEAPSLNKPVLVLRESTERPEGLETGALKLVGTDRQKILDSASELLCDQTAYARMANALNPYGDGRAGERIIEAATAFLS